jgi:hypothetical protein
MKLPPNFRFYDGRSLVTLLCDLRVQPRHLEQLKRQQHLSHQDQYERWPRSRIKSFRKEYRHVMRRYLPDPLIEPPPPKFERLSADAYERAVYLNEQSGRLT